MNENEKLVFDAAAMIEGKKKLTCADACKLSTEHNISLKEIGEICNQQGIKITSCELGCFK
ncbi:MAG TPA: hypothetical protein VGJ94_10035 [Syntrophorhabdaceae bacterium]|jgi:predicted peroxiredoxin